MGELPADEPINSVRRLLADAERVTRELGLLADEMRGASEAARREAERLIAALTAAAALIAASEGVGEGGDTGPAPSLRAGGSEGASLLARQMLAGGADRDAVERDLRTNFGIKDAAAVVDSVIGGRP